ncbi:hypothetical protein ACWFQ8_24310 [Streptomyces sp. NPDC055254]
MATLGHGVAVACRPGLLARPCGLAEYGSSALLIRALGVRDAVIGAAMLAAPEGAALRTAVLGRIAVDVGDALLFGTFLARRAERVKAASSALAWAALCGWTLTGGGRPAGTLTGGGRPAGTLTGGGRPAAPLLEDAANVAVRAAQSATRADI